MEKDIFLGGCDDQVVLLLTMLMEMCIAQAVSTDPKVPWGTRSRGGTGEEEQVRCVTWVRLIWMSGCVNEVKTFFWILGHLKRELNLDYIATANGSFLFIEHNPL